MKLRTYVLLLGFASFVAIAGSAVLTGGAFADAREGRPWRGSGPYWIVALLSFLVMAATDFWLRIRRLGVVVLKPGPFTPPGSRLVRLGFFLHAAASTALVLGAMLLVPGGRLPGGWWASLLIPVGTMAGLWLVVLSRTRFHERRMLRG